MADPTAKFILDAEDHTGRAFASADRGLRTLSRTVASTRSLFASFGVALGGRALLNWVTNAVKAADATGEHAEQIRRAKEALDSMKKSSDELAVSIGVKLVPAWEALSAVMTGWNRIISGADPFPFEAQIESMRTTLNGLKQQLFSSQGMPVKFLDDLRKQIADTEAAIDSLVRKQSQALGLTPGAPDLAEIVPGNGKVPELPISLRLVSMPDWKELFAPGDGLDFVKAGNGASLEVPVSMQLQTISQSEIDALFKPIQDEGKFTAEFIGEQFRDSFADWILGAEHSFKDLLKRLAVEFATSAIFSGIGSLFPGGSFLSRFFGGSRASGGSAREGMVYRVHPGEAFFTPGQDGHVGATGGGDINLITNIDARGASSELAERLPGILRENNMRLKAELREDSRRRRR